MLLEAYALFGVLLVVLLGVAALMTAAEALYVRVKRCRRVERVPRPARLRIVRCIANLLL